MVWTDYRRATKEDDYGSADIYMYDLSTGKESPVTTAAGEQSGPTTNGKVVVWLDRRKSPDPTASDASDIYGYDLATRKEFAISTSSASKSDPSISGNLVVWAEYQGATQSIYSYDITTKQKSLVIAAPALSGVDISGKIIVWEQVKAPDPFSPVEIHGYDMNTRQSFTVATGDTSQHTPSISGGQVVWVGNPSFQGGRDDIIGAAITGIPIEPSAIPVPRPAPTSRLFPDTGKGR